MHKNVHIKMEKCGNAKKIHKNLQLYLYNTEKCTKRVANGKKM